MAKQWKNEDIIYPEDAQRWESGLENAQQNNAQNETNLKNHTDNKSNPHNVTAAQTGAYTKAEVDTKDASVLSTAKAYTDLHSVKKDNPHGVTAAQVGAYSKAESDSNLTAALLSKTNSRGYSNGTVTDISGVDLNSLNETGTFMGSALTNAPSSSWWFITNLVHTSNYITQIAYVVSATTDRPRVRKKSNGIWGEWQTIMFTSDNAVSSSKLQSPRQIAGVDFDGTKDIAIPANNVGAYTKTETDSKLVNTKNEIISGNVASASKLQSQRKINGISFDGTSDITIKAMPQVDVIPENSDLNDYKTAGFYGCSLNVTAATIKNSPAQVAFSLVVMNAANTSITTQIFSEYTTNAGTKMWIRRCYTTTWGSWYQVAVADGTLQSGLFSQTASKLNAARTISLTGGITGQVSFDGTTNVAIPTTIEGNAPSATKLQTSRKINGIAFDGTSDISITADPNQQTIPANTNLDNLTTPGFWTSVSDGNTSTLTNTPFGNGTFSLQVETGLNNTRIYQTAKRMSNGDIAVRSKTESAAWSSWTGIAKNNNTQQTGLIAEKATSLNSARNISLSGGATGTAVFDGSKDISIGVTVSDNSHKHTIANITDLQGNLDSKTNVRGHSNSTVTQISNTNLNDLAESGVFMGSTMINAPDTGWWYIQSMVHNANYITQVAYCLNSTDQKIRIRIKNNGTWQSWQTFALTTDTAPSATKLAAARTISLTGGVTGSATFDGSSNTSISATLAGNAPTASKLATPRTISLSGAVTGSANFDGSSNLSIATTSEIAIAKFSLSDVISTSKSSFSDAFWQYRRQGDRVDFFARLKFSSGATTTNMIDIHSIPVGFRLSSEFSDTMWNVPLSVSVVGNPSNHEMNGVAERQATNLIRVGSSTSGNKYVYGTWFTDDPFPAG